MRTVEIYTTRFCGYCHAANRRLTQKGVSFSGIDLSHQPARWSEMMGRSGGRHSVPQIFFGRSHLGGFDDLAALERAGRLDPLLAN